MAKFKVAKPFNILHVLKVFLDDFKFNIENISNLLETCGRFLLRYEGTAEVAKRMVSGFPRYFRSLLAASASNRGVAEWDFSQVELMRKKQANMHLDQRHQLMLENAFYMVSGSGIFTWPRRWPAKKKRKKKNAVIDANNL